MENRTVFVLTLKGEGEIKNHTRQLPEDLKRVLALVDDDSTVEILSRRAAPSLRTGLHAALQQLEKNGYIRDKTSPAGSNMPHIAKPKIVTPAPKAEAVDDLDFTSVIKVRAEAEAKAEQEAEAIRLKKEQAAAAKAQLEAAQVKAEAEAKAHAVAEAKAKQEVQAARIKAEQATAQARAEAEAVRAKAEQEAEKARVELETARVEADRVRAELEAARVEAEALTKREAEVTKLRAEAAAAKAQAETEIARIKAEREAALAEAKTLQEAEAVRIKAEAEARARQEADAIRRKAEEEVAQARAEAEATRLKAEQEMAKAKAEVEEKLRQEIETKARQEAETIRRKAEEEVAQVRAEAEAARLKAEQETAQAKAEVEEKLRQEIETRAKQEAEAARLKAEQEIARARAEAEEEIRRAAEARRKAESALAAKLKADAAAQRSMIATVLFFDVVGYTKQSVSKQIELKKQFNALVSEFIGGIEESQRIILDTGDGAAIGFLQHPEDAIEVALKFRKAVTANGHRDHPDLRVRIGIHLGPVNIVKDMNGQSNMVGDGINDAQRIMSFASADQIFISRSYYDIVSRLSADYANLFQYRGVKNDKHGRQHQVYEAAAEAAASEAGYGDTPRPSGQQESSPFSIQLDPALLDNLGQTEPVAAKPMPAAPAEPEITIDIQLPPDESPEEIARREEQKAKERAQAELAAEAARVKAETEAKEEAQRKAEAARQAEKEAEAARIKAEKEAAEARLKAEKEAAKAEQEARKLAEEQSRAWAEAGQRAQAQAAAAAKTEAAQQPAPPPRPAARTRHKPLPLGKIAAGLLVLLLALVAALPYVWPMQGYIGPLEARLSAQLQQPVHIAHMKAALLPLPKLELQDVSIGGAQELKAANVVLNFDAGALFAETKSIRNAEVNDLVLDAGSFMKALSWLRAAGSDPHYPVSRITLNHAHLGGSTFPALSGNADRDGKDSFSKVALRSDDGKLDLDLQQQQANWRIALRLRGNSLPWLPGIPFSELNVTGEAGTEAADLTGVDGVLYGGRFSGDARLNWQNGWQMRGRLTVRQAELQQALPQSGLEGTMDVDGNFTFDGTSLLQPGNARRLDGTFVVSKGVIGKMDMVETAARRQNMNGGRTHFDEASGSFQAENGDTHLRQLRISSGAMDASGSVDVSAEGHLSGRMAVDLKMRPGSTSMALSGTLDNPMLRP